MAKMMLLLIASEEIKNGRFSAEDPVRVSERSAHTGGSRVGLEEGQIYPLGELMKAAIIKSANDAAVAVAEKVGGSVEATVRMMNKRAQELGMTRTLYQTVDGLPPRPTHDADVTTARDPRTGRISNHSHHRSPQVVEPGRSSFRRGRMHVAYDQSSDWAFRRMRRPKDRVHFPGWLQPDGDG